ncbi:MAG: TA system VapC family ribonuclease toxin [Rhodospirillaceae bacterium]|nr:TA system VapC family ribonuclease toxin [Rhodospirillaceae bacterium]
MRALFDVNVLIALFDPAHIHHEPAHAWWRRERPSGWASCPLTQNGFVRVLSQPKYPNPVSVSEASSRLRAATMATDHVFWPDDLSILDTARVDTEHILSPGLITDLYLLALVVRRKGRLVTFDRTIPPAAVPGAGSHQIVVLPDQR